MIAWTELTHHERLAIAAALRLIIRADDRFDPSEREKLEVVAARLIPRDALWQAIGESATTLTSVDAMKEAVIAVSRPEARELLVAACEVLAEVHAGAPRFFEGLRDAWSKSDARTRGPFR